jgi:hypothetical protein
MKFFFSAVSFLQFLIIKAMELDRIRIRIGSGFGSVFSFKMLDPDEMNAYPQPCF